MTYETIKVEQDGPACVVTMNRPERRNAVSLKMMDELLAAAGAAEADPAQRAMIITGGESYFSAGADLNEALQVKGGDAGAKYFGSWHRLTRGLETVDLPVIAAIEGFCVTGGLEMALACDIRVGAEGSSYGVTSSRIGTVAGAGGTQRLPRIVGPAKALEMLFSAESIDAAEAHRIGLINRLVPKGGALMAAKEMVGVYTQRAPLSLGFVSFAVYGGLQMDLDSGLEFETFLVSTIYNTEDKHEGISAFLEKRTAVFKGR